MVVATSDSCNTLISLDNNVKRVQPIQKAEEEAREEETFYSTDLLLPEDDFGDCCDDEEPCWAVPKVEQHLYLPSDETQSVDMYLRSVPQIMETADELLANPPRTLDQDARERLLYVGQGELAHATPSQCDVLVSDRATTCHILAVRSTKMGNEPLVSLTHIDAAGCYQDCIRGIFQQHKIHHNIQCDDKEEEEKKQDDFLSTQEEGRIQMELHLLGGFEDANGTSRKISNFLLQLLSRIATEESAFIRTTLQTCVLSSMNDTGHACPIGRGLGIDLKTGRVFLAKVDASAMGPNHELRAVRIWSGNSGKRLSIIHTSQSNNVMIEPFQFEPFKELQILLELPDQVILDYVSTSPLVEQDDFCDNVRRTLRFMLKFSSSDIFEQPQRPLLYQRQQGAAFNDWKRA